MIKDLKITMAASLAPGEEWVVDSREMPSGTLVSLLPNPTSNPIIIPNVDDELCFQVGVAKKCTSGYLGERQILLVGACESTPDYYFTFLSPPCSGISSAYRLNGTMGDTVVVRLTYSGLLQWDGNVSNGGAGATVQLIGGGENEIDGSPHITTTTSTGFTTSVDITFVMPTATVDLNTNVVLNNSVITGVGAANLELVSVNGVANGLLYNGVCKGISSGAW